MLQHLIKRTASSVQLKSHELPPERFQAWKTDQDTWAECGESQAHVSGTFLLALTAFTIKLHWQSFAYRPRWTRFACLYNSLFSSDMRSIFVCFDTWSFDFETHAILSHALHSPTYTRRAKPRKYSWNFKFLCLEDVSRGKVKVNVWWLYDVVHRQIQYSRGSRGMVWYVSSFAATLGLGLQCEYQKGAWRVLWFFMFH